MPTSCLAQMVLGGSRMGPVHEESSQPHQPAPSTLRHTGFYPGGCRTQARQLGGQLAEEKCLLSLSFKTFPVMPS